jgi:hypothetical protein
MYYMYVTTGVSTVPSPMNPMPRSEQTATLLRQRYGCFMYFGYVMCYYCALIKCIFLLHGVVDAGTFVVRCGNASCSMCLT